ncbi:ribbon-helix-helix domain-containing protein [Allocoleopsis franciscana]|uniref:Ribbon-helix-helix protein, copG family n=1 Tax=Allocoleopsis franciscana PCC 7113 TaxID=1173027 RepID=K9WQ30_9CYAN|nr:ribbon-helix-helix domain-containing protein [Allocoleopsis franciscana]AFZ22283.1 Ribbon-helix-helix protein, copG family [Allocoleopsis franciscana PCC 7113]
MPPSPPPCPNETCDSYGKPDYVVRNGSYRKTKQDKQKTQRYLCKFCCKTFVPEPLPIRRSYRPQGKGKKGNAAYEEKKENRTFTLTNEAYAGLEQLALRRGLSRSELVERIGRELIRLEDG